MRDFGLNDTIADGADAVATGFVGEDDAIVGGEGEHRPTHREELIVDPGGDHRHPARSVFTVLSMTRSRWSRCSSRALLLMGGLTGRLFPRVRGDSLGGDPWVATVVS